MSEGIFISGCSCNGGGDSGHEAQLAVSTTYTSLLALRNGGNLVPGTWYRITDYQCSTTQENTQVAKNQYDIIVRADDASHLNENAFAARHYGDTYFANSRLEAWQLKYSIDNDANRFAWADPEGKGVVYWMKDEWNNQASYDFKSILFERTLTDGQYDGQGDKEYVYTFNAWSNGKICDATVLQATNLLFKCSENVIEETRDATSNQPYKMLLSNNVFLNVYNQYSGFNCFGNIIGFGSIGNTFGSGCNSNSFGSGCSGNTFGSGCSGNTFGSKCCDNSFKIGCSGNSFGSDCNRNSFGSGCSGNTFGSDCNSNSLDKNCSDNSFGSGCNSNSFGSDCNRNSFGSDCSGNTFKSGCEKNSFGSDCSGNTFGSDCNSNSLDKNCSDNSFGSGCNSNSFGSDCSGNTFKSGCEKNSFGSGCNSNSFGSGCSGNTFGSYCKQITVFNGVIYCQLRDNGSSSSYVQNAQILSGTAGIDIDHKLEIDFNTGQSYTQCAGIKTGGGLSIWNPAD